MTAEPPAYYSLREVARLYRLDERTLRRWIAKGAVHPTRVGPTSRIRLSAAEVRKLARETGQEETS
jgi:excisionase family DNA binding protein